MADDEYKEENPQRLGPMPVPKRMPPATWRRIEARVKAHCETMGDEKAWNRKRRDECIYGSLNRIRKDWERRH